LIAEFEVPFEYPRTDSIRYTPEFARLTGAVNEALHDAYATTPTGAHAPNAPAGAAR
jgi:NitT/TauT family transport system ATP-binding protein